MEKKTVEGKKISAREKKRRDGYAKWLKKVRREKKKKEKLKLKEKEKEKKKKEKERLKKLKEKKKKSVGRPKKRGPKRKRKKKVIKPPRIKVTYDYKIISCHVGKQIGYIDKYSKLEDAYNAIEELLKDSQQVIFPKKTTTSKCIKQESIHEYLILERNRDLNKTNPLLRNEYGKLIENKLNSEKWVIVDKFKYNVEETFWIYGYHPNIERKTFIWVYENFILRRLLKIDDIIRILKYKNKIIFKYDDGKIEMVICKNTSDTIRFYNLLETYIQNDNISQVFFLGSYDLINNKRKKLEEELIELTGWDLLKIRRSSSTKSKYKSQ